MGWGAKLETSVSSGCGRDLLEGGMEEEEVVEEEWLAGATTLQELETKVERRKERGRRGN